MSAPNSDICSQTISHSCFTQHLIIFLRENGLLTHLKQNTFEKEIFFKKRKLDLKGCRACRAPFVCCAHSWLKSFQPSSLNFVLSPSMARSGAQKFTEDGLWLILEHHNSSSQRSMFSKGFWCSISYCSCKYLHHCRCCCFEELCVFCCEWRWSNPAQICVQARSLPITVPALKGCVLMAAVQPTHLSRLREKLLKMKNPWCKSNIDERRPLITCLQLHKALHELISDLFTGFLSPFPPSLICWEMLNGEMEACCLKSNMLLQALLVLIFFLSTSLLKGDPPTRTHTAQCSEQSWHYLHIVQHHDIFTQCSSRCMFQTCSLVLTPLWLLLSWEVWPWVQLQGLHSLKLL